MTGEEFYGRLAPEFRLGPSFRLIDEVRRRDGEAIARLHVPRRRTPGPGPSCSRSTRASRPGRGRRAPARPDGPVALGYGHEAFRRTGHVRRELWSWAMLRDERSGGLEATCACSTSGGAVADIRGVRFRRVGRETLRRLAVAAGAASPARRAAP